MTDWRHLFRKVRARLAGYPPATGGRRSQIDPALIVEQRAKGWVDFHPEDYCHECGSVNAIWSSPEWFELASDRVHTILCPPCFMNLDPDSIWKVTRQVWPDAEPVGMLTGFLAGIGCSEPERVARCVIDAGWSWSGADDE